MTKGSREMQDHLLGGDVRVDGLRLGRCTAIRFEQESSDYGSALCTRYKAVIEAAMDIEAIDDIHEYYHIMEVMG